MDRKIIGVMVALVVVAVVVVAFVMIAAGGGIHARAGGFTSLFDELTNPGQESHDQQLALPSDWRVNDIRRAADTIVDLSYEKGNIAQTTVYVTTLYFAYLGDKWGDPFHGGTSFQVPDTSFDGWMQVNNGVFHISVSSATNLSAHYQPGDVIEVQSILQTNVNSALAFGEWSVVDTI